MEAWTNVLLRVDPETLKNCRQVSKSLKSIIEDYSFWIEKAILENNEESLPPLKWRQATFREDFGHKFNYKAIVSSGKGYKAVRPYRIEPDLSPEQHAEKYKMFVRSTGDGRTLETCFAFSYVPSTIAVFVDLAEWGIDNWVMDFVRPKIRISQLVNHHRDCPAEFSFAAELNYKPRQIKHEPEDDTELIQEVRDFKRYKHIRNEWNVGEQPVIWEEMIIEMADYPSGLRHLSVITRGCDDNKWRGHFETCPKFEINEGLRIEEETLVSPAQLFEFSDGVQIYHSSQEEHTRLFSVLSYDSCITKIEIIGLKAFHYFKVNFCQHSKELCTLKSDSEGDDEEICSKFINSNESLIRAYIACPRDDFYQTFIIISQMTEAPNTQMPIVYETRRPKNFALQVGQIAVPIVEKQIDENLQDFNKRVNLDYYFMLIGYTLTIILNGLVIIILDLVIKKPKTLPMARSMMVKAETETQIAMNDDKKEKSLERQLKDMQKKKNNKK
ncbi:unnamed protein product [Caenorhabditis bovis]|uniref:FBA domain-containing protein n=1 Tax=Caenorhabditis bovis TaxID=2654633 RepID=A0A8S1EPN6_9PELO|nr:unnamed protein product [Caenorhabditis bovis]